MTGKQNSADGLSAATKRMAQILDAPFVRRDTQNSAGVPVDVRPLPPMKPGDFVEVDAAEAKRINDHCVALLAHIAAEPARMREVAQQVVDAVVGSNADMHRSASAAYQACCVAATSARNAILAQEIKP